MAADVAAPQPGRSRRNGALVAELRRTFAHRDGLPSARMSKNIRTRPISLEAEESVHFDDERPISERQESAGRRGVVLIGVDEEDLAAGLIFPPVPQVGSKRAINGTEL